jgi:hypothetical protein
LNRDGYPTRPLFWTAERIVDLQPGDQIRHNGKRYKVASVKPFLQHENVPAEFLREQGRTDGFLVP